MQRLFVYSALAAFVLPVGYDVYMAAVQYSSNPNLSSYYWVMIYMLAAPILFFAIAYFLSDKKKPAQSRLFVSCFLAACGMFTLVALNTLFSHLMISLTLVFSDAFWDWFNFQLGSAAIVIGFYTVFLMVLKRKSGF